MAKDVNIHVKAKGTQQTKQQLDSVGKATEGVGQKAKKGAAGVDKLSGSASKARGLFSRFTSGLTGWATKLIGITAIIAAVTKAINIQGEALKEHARIAEEQRKKLLSLQYLGEFFAERPQLRKEVAAHAEFGRRPFTEVAEAWYVLRSQASRMTPEQRRGILREASELGRMYPEAPLTDLVNMFTLYAKATRAQDLNQVQNVLLQTITEAGGGMADVSRFMPMFLGTGMAGGLTGAQAAGLWAYATTLPEAGRPERATTALTNVLMALQGKGTPEAQKMLRQFGIRPEMGFFEQMEILAAQREAGRFGLPQAELLGQREGAAMLLGLLREPQAMKETIANIVAAGVGRRDITRDMITRLMGADEVARLEEENRLEDIRIENLKARDKKAQLWEALLRKYERGMREEDLPEIRIDIELGLLRLLGGVGGAAWLEEKSTMQRRINGAIEGPTIINIEHNETIYEPTAGTAADRGIGERSSPEDIR